MYLLVLGRVLVTLLTCQDQRTRGHVIKHVCINASLFPLLFPLLYTLSAFLQRKAMREAANSAGFLSLRLPDGSVTWIRNRQARMP